MGIGSGAGSEASDLAGRSKPEEREAFSIGEDFDLAGEASDGGRETPPIGLPERQQRSQPAA